MMLGKCHIQTTTPPTKTNRKFRKIVNLAHRQRHLYGKPRRYNTGKELDPETGLYYYGARYLDPKTSRWLSGDPAVGEYIPQAGRQSNGLPGMGGVYNTTNLHTYHYAGNNPVKYIDPDGRSPLLQEERNTFIEILGTSYAYILDNIIYTPRQVNEQEVRLSIIGLNLDNVPTAMSPNLGINGISLPGGRLYIPNDARYSGLSDPMAHLLSTPMLSILMHELFHQIQYEKYGTENAFQKLLNESSQEGNPYEYDLNSLIGKTIWEISNYEAQGKFVEDFTKFYLNGRNNNSFSQDIKNMAQILKDSGFSSTAINTVLNSP